MWNKKMPCDCGGKPKGRRWLWKAFHKVGKTTTVGNLEIELAKLGKKAFAIDANAQGNLVANLGSRGNRQMSMQA